LFSFPVGARLSPPILNFDQAVALEQKSETTANASIGDLDGDGDIDIVLAKGRHWPLVIFINDGKGGFVEKHPFGLAKSATRAIALGDLDGDRRLDIVIGDEAGGGGFIYDD
jgi:FG-GAP-like repeat